MKAVDVRQDLPQVQETAAGRRRRRLESFHPCYRRYIAELTCCASEVEDLADSFPGLLFALVSRYATVEQRQRAFDLVCTGEPLRQAADALGLAWWLRRLPAHAFTEPLPAFPVDGDFSVHIANLMAGDRDIESSAPIRRKRFELDECAKRSERERDRDKVRRRHSNPMMARREIMT